MSQQRINKAESVFELWHKKGPRSHVVKDLSGTRQDFEPFMSCVGTAISIIYDSDKWERDKEFFSYIHGFDSRPKVYCSSSSVSPEEQIGKKRKTTSFLDISNLNQPLIVAQLAYATSFTYKNKDGEEVEIGLGKRKSPCFSTNDLKTVIILTPDGPLFIHGKQMRVTRRGIVK